MLQRFGFILTVFTVSSGTLFCLVRTVHSAMLLDSCSKHSDCKPANSACSILSPSCGRGTCTCKAGFWDDGSGSCLKGVPLNESCDLKRNEFCFVTNSQCTDGICKCTDGFQPGPGDSQIACTKGVGFYGSSCASNDDCYSFGHLQCIYSVCQCKQGYNYHDSYNCRKRVVGDACRYTEDCSAMPNMACDVLSRTCQCIGGTRSSVVTIKGPYFVLDPLVDKFRSVSACLRPDEQMSAENGSCTYEARLTNNVDRSLFRLNKNYLDGSLEEATLSAFFYETDREVKVPETTRYCEAPFRCSVCSSYRAICGRPSLALISASVWPSRIDFDAFALNLLISLIILTEFRQ